MDNEHTAIEAIKKKLIGKPLTYKEIYAVMDSLAHERLSTILTTYFAASSFKEGFSDEELYFLTKAMVETGKTLHFDGIVADKHSMGGVPGTRTSMIVVPIIAAAGYKIPKNSSRAITSPCGTADVMEVLSPVTFQSEDVSRIVSNVGGCIVWSGKLGLAPADDVLIRVEEAIGFESYDKMIVSIMAKKIASGATHVVFDVPVGEDLKIHTKKDADIIKRKLQLLSEKFHIASHIEVHDMYENAGRGIGPVLEAKDVLEVLEQKQDRPLGLEAHALRLAGSLLDLCFAHDPAGSGKKGEDVARQLLQTGKANEKMHEIIGEQGGNPDVTSASLQPGGEQHDMGSEHRGYIARIYNKNVSVISRILGCPHDSRAGMYFHKKKGETLDQHDILCTLYSSDAWRLKEAVETVRHMPLFSVGEK